MTIDAAIDYIREEATTCACDGKPNTSAALKLGIEALKRLRDCRHNWNLTITERLPGETED